MPSLPDTAVIILLGLLLFGPKGLAQIARQIGKLMGEFRRASNEFRMQMEEELRIAEQTDRQKQIAAVEAAAPVVPALASSPDEELVFDHPHLRPEIAGSPSEAAPEPPPIATSGAPIATSGEISIMPPSTGLPEPRSSSLASLIDAVPKVDPPGTHRNGDASSAHNETQDDVERSIHYTDHRASVEATTVAAEEPLHG